MAITQTYTKTKTIARLSLVKIQVMSALRRASDISDVHLAAVRRGLENRWIGQVIIYGFDSTGACRAGLFLSIDWRVHQLHIDAGHEMVAPGVSWRELLAPEVDEMVVEFVDFCRRSRLIRDWRVRYAPRVPVEMANRALGFYTPMPVKWAGRSQVLGYQLQEIDEFGVEIHLVD